MAIATLPFDGGRDKPHEIRIDQIRFVKELYPRLKPTDEDGSIEPVQFIFLEPGRRLWMVKPAPPCGWSVEMHDFVANRKSVTHGGFHGEGVMMTLTEWGLPQDAVWRAVPFDPKPRPSSHVYAIGTKNGGMIKIGRALDVSRRLMDIQRMSPVPLYVLWTVPGGHKLETKLHSAFAQRRAYGEWFDFSGLDAVAAISTEAGQ